MISRRELVMWAGLSTTNLLGTGCSPARVTTGVLLRDLASNTLLFDLHVAFWWEQWRPCFAIYESANGFCRNVCDQLSWKALIVVIYAALAVTLAAWVAEALAAAIAAALLGMAFVLSPF